MHVMIPDRSQEHHGPPSASELEICEPEPLR